MFVQSIQCLIREPNSPIIPPALLARTSNQQYDPSQQTRSTAYRPSTLQSTPGPPPLPYSLGPDGPLILQSASHSHRPSSPSTPTDQVQSINVRASQYSISHTLAHSYFTSLYPVALPFLANRLLIHTLLSLDHKRVGNLLSQIIQMELSTTLNFLLVYLLQDLTLSKSLSSLPIGLMHLLDCMERFFLDIFQ